MHSDMCKFSYEFKYYLRARREAQTIWSKCVLIFKANRLTLELLILLEYVYVNLIKSQNKFIFQINYISVKVPIYTSRQMN